jgi:hypothetical protein
MFTPPSRAALPIFTDEDSKPHAAPDRRRRPCQGRLTERFYNPLGVGEGGARALLICAGRKKNPSRGFGAPERSGGVWHHEKE